jgi:hypothetical protein
LSGPGGGVGIPCPPWGGLGPGVMLNGGGGGCPLAAPGRGGPGRGGPPGGTGGQPAPGLGPGGRWLPGGGGGGRLGGVSSILPNGYPTTALMMTAVLDGPVQMAHEKMHISDPCSQLLLFSRT